ncbi:MAG: VPLPA-CTERM sorting domain-containing protein [Pseudomonadota bacterium]
MMNLTKIAAVSAMILSLGTTAQAATMNFSQGQTENASAILHAEGEGVVIQDGVLFADYVVGENLSVGDTFNGRNTASNLIEVDGGTYSSHLIHFDPLGSNGGSASGTFDFVGRIVAIIVSNNTSGGGRLLNDTDALFSGDTYEQSVSRRSENSDVFQLIDGNTLAYDFRTVQGYIDNVRVVTAVPLPASALLMLGGLAAIGLVRSKRRRV